MFPFFNERDKKRKFKGLNLWLEWRITFCASYYVWCTLLFRRRKTRIFHNSLMMLMSWHKIFIIDFILDVLIFYKIFQVLAFTSLRLSSTTTILISENLKHEDFDRFQLGNHFEVCRNPRTKARESMFLSRDLIGSFEDCTVFLRWSTKIFNGFFFLIDIFLP